jgi:hypothetical protein
MAPEAHQSFLVALQRGSPPSCTHRDTFTRDPARKCSGVDFIFQKKSFGTAVAKKPAICHRRAMSGTEATLVACWRGPQVKVLWGYRCLRRFLQGPASA